MNDSLNVQGLTFEEELLFEEVEERLAPSTCTSTSCDCTSTSCCVDTVESN